jgi:hypothetical protein
MGREIEITVNGVGAMVYADQFVANHVPIESGENTITATGTDMNGNTETASITVYGSPHANYVTVVADPESGIAPFETTLRIEAPFTIANTSLTYTGPAQVEFLDNSDPRRYVVRILTEGLYHFTVEAWDGQGNSYSDTVTVGALNLLELDALLKAKWNGMKTALINGDIAQALTFHHPLERHRYEAVYTLLGSDLRTKAQQMREIELIFAEGNRAKYRITRDQDMAGQMVTMTYYIYFGKDENGLWTIESY